MYDEKRLTWYWNVFFSTPNTTKLIDSTELIEQLHLQNIDYQGDKSNNVTIFAHNFNVRYLHARRCILRVKEIKKIMWGMENVIYNISKEKIGEYNTRVKR